MKYLAAGTPPQIRGLDNYWNNQEDYFNLSPGTSDTQYDPLYGLDYELGDGSWCVDSIPFTEGDTATEDFVGTSRPQGEGFDTGAYEMPSASQFPLNISIIPSGGGTVDANKRNVLDGLRDTLRCGNDSSFERQSGPRVPVVRWENDDGSVLGADQSLSVTMDSENGAAVFEKVYFLTVRGPSPRAPEPFPSMANPAGKAA